MPFEGLASLILASGHVSLKPALLLSDAAYDLGFGLFALGHQASELLSPLCFFATPRTVRGFGRFGFSFWRCELDARFASQRCGVRFRVWSLGFQLSAM